MNKVLKPCPFCGGVPKTSHRAESEASGGGHVAFVACYCGGYASTAHQMGHAETVQDAIAEVVEKWNRRAQPAEADGVVAWAPSTALEKLRNRHNNAPCVLTDGPAEFNDVPLVPLAALSAVTAERDRLRKSNESRSDKLNEAQAIIDQLRAEVETLRPIHAMILNALDRDAEEGKTARGEMAAELRAALAAKEA